MNSESSIVEAGGQDEPVKAAVPRDLLRELRLAMAKCTPKQRAWLRNLANHNFQLWGKSREDLGLSKNTIHTWLRLDTIKRVRELQDEIAVEDLDISTRRVLAEYSRLAFSDIRQAFNALGKLKHPSEWTDESRRTESRRAPVVSVRACPDSEEAAAQAASSVNRVINEPVMNRA